ncbi:MAG: hypothetical protein NC485_06470 [Ruminococcus flavefaciens]|nr:hypothetical protein [Ruminococcus flavefaciens]MCM1060461.1 hypothetical protein [Eubacterium sp.]
MSDNRMKKIMVWLRDFRLRDIWWLQSDEEDIVLIINKIMVIKDSAAKVQFIDDSV